MLTIRKIPCPENKIKIKCPYMMTPEDIIIHNTANDAAAENEIKYMHSNNKEVSFHFAVDDIEAVQGIELNRNSWSVKDKDKGVAGNRRGISIEICYSKSGGVRWLKAVDNAAELTAKLLKDYGWGIDKVTKHQDYDGKHCPHRILDVYGWDNFLNLVKSKMGEPAQPAEPVPTPQPTKVDVFYQIWDDIKNTWLPNVKNTEDYAGIFGHDVCAVFANLSQGNITYAVHYKGGRWLPEVTSRSDYAGIYNRPIDGIMMKTDTGRTVRYRVHLRRKNKWLPWVTGYNAKDSNNGYAGILGQEIDGIQIELL